jgi:hypothetical protein
MRIHHTFSVLQTLPLSSASSLGLDHLIGTPALKPYMHGYFLSLKLYDAARVIANPYVYEEHRAKVVQEKLDKLAEGRIRTRKDQAKVKVNKALAEKITQEEGRAKKREEGKRKKATEDGDAAMDVDVDVDEVPAAKQKTSLLSDPRFAALFEDPDFEVDEASREYALLNPSAVALKKGRMPEVEGKGWGRGKTAVEDEEEESDKVSSDNMSDSDSESLGSEDVDERGAESEDSSEAGGTVILFITLIHLEPLMNEIPPPPPRHHVPESAIICTSPPRCSQRAPRPSSSTSIDNGFGPYSSSEQGHFLFLRPPSICLNSTTATATT